MARRFRFGVQLVGSEPQKLVERALRAEAVGFDVVLASDHVGPANTAPLITLASIAQATTRIRLGTFVLNNDMRNPLQLAWDATTLDRLSKGRFELGIGAGHTPHEYAATGIAFDSASARKRRLRESVEIICRLLDGDTVDYEGEYFQLSGACIDRALQTRLPILVGGNGESLLGHAGQHADIIGLQGLGRTLADGHNHEVRWDPSWLDTQTTQVRAGAGDRIDELEFNALVQVAAITADARAVYAQVSKQLPTVPPDLAGAVPYALVGTVDEIVAKLFECRRRWGISYFVVRNLESFAPVIEAVRSAE